MIQLVRVPVERVLELWSLVSPILHRAYEINHGTDTLEDCRNDLVNDLSQLWIAFEDEKVLAACVTMILAEGETKVCRIRALGGTKFKRWRHFMADIEAFAKQENCRLIRIETPRQGWRRVFPDYYEPYLVLERRL